MSQSCDKCKWAILWDFGYSNYTVKGTDLVCAQRAHPEGKSDRFYGEDKRLLHAEQCDYYSEGNPVKVDVEATNLEDWRNDFSPAQVKTWELHVTMEMLEGER